RREGRSHAHVATAINRFRRGQAPTHGSALRKATRMCAVTQDMTVFGRGVTLAVISLSSVLTLAQSATSLAPLRTAPVEKFTVNPGHRDWGPTVISGTAIIGGNSTNRGGLFAVDTVTGTLKWTFRPTGAAS